MSVPQTEAAAARDAGMLQAAAHAESVSPQWQEDAFRFLTLFAASRDEAFTSEDVRRAAPAELDCGVPKAWGNVFRKAARAGHIVKVGYGVAQQRHLSPTVLWKAAA
jgi:hypothetical protein